MADSLPDRSVSPGQSARGNEYVVVARRYRPQGFGELVGQEPVARALSNAITTHRVGHAYLFTGARGVGKTSTARILAKALNCEHGPTPTPCNECDICRSITAGDDVDVLEIDGASNRGIDEIRQLRQNVNIRPSRERFKIYIIDEVHMLTREAFNALLKTLEEPPEHVKFIFCTTEAAKIPITILSRCQRFDFAGIDSRSITDRLRQIVEAEGVSAESEALELLARRAAGSMRDSQSLLEQLLAFAPERITVADVNRMLGTAGEERLSALLGHIAARNPAGALSELDAAAGEGVDLGQLLEQLLGYLRDCMLAAAGCPAEMFLYVSPSSRTTVNDSGRRLGLETLLAAMQILDQTLGRLRVSTQTRILVELAVVRLCGLEDLASLPALIAQLQSGGISVPAVPASGDRRDLRPGAGSGPGPAASRPVAPTPAPSPPPGGDPGDVKKNVEVATPPASAPAPAPQASAPALPFCPENAPEIWNLVVAGTSGLAADNAKQAASVAISGPNRLAVSFRPGYTFSKEFCERPDQKARLEQILAGVTGKRIVLEFRMQEEKPAASQAPASARAATPLQRLMQVSQHAMVQRAAELFGANAVRVDESADKP
jgi:DNA polymerase-3 subunit gamma/tau